MLAILGWFSGVWAEVMKPILVRILSLALIRSEIAVLGLVMELLIVRKKKSDLIIVQIWLR